MKLALTLLMLALCGCQSKPKEAPKPKGIPLRTYHWVHVSESFDATAILVDDKTGESCGKIRPLGKGPAFESLTKFGTEGEWENETKAMEGVEVICKKEQP
jgi:hypothetical protein